MRFWGRSGGGRKGAMDIPFDPHNALAPMKCFYPCLGSVQLQFTMHNCATVGMANTALFKQYGSDETAIYCLDGVFMSGERK